MSKKNLSAGTKGHTSPRVRDAETGVFVPSEEASKRPATTITENVPHPGWGLESSTPIGRDAESGQFMPVGKAQKNPKAVVTRVPKK
jgi:hypothetical protein